MPDMRASVSNTTASGVAVKLTSTCCRNACSILSPASDNRVRFRCIILRRLRVNCPQSRAWSNTRGFWSLNGTEATSTLFMVSQNSFSLRSVSPSLAAIRFANLAFHSRFCTTASSGASSFACFAITSASP